MTEQELLIMAEKEGWGCISECQKLSEEFIEKYIDKVDWFYISQCQKLSEGFIEKHADRVDWIYISICQKLSKKFIEKHIDEVDWHFISKFQKLSEEFIGKYADMVNWDFISQHQKLSEKFIENYANKVSWNFISICQKLSEEFIEKHIDKVNLWFVSKYQKLSEEFMKKYNLQKSKNSWLYTSKEEKLDYIKKYTSYEMIDDEYIVAYKSVRNNDYSVFNFQYKYEVGCKYNSHCDCNLENENSFGLSAWTKEKALEYYDVGKLLKVKISIENIGAIVKNNNKIRCFELEVLEALEVLEEVKMTE